MRILGPATVLAVVLALASGCSDDEPSADPEPSGAASSGTPSETPSESASPSPTVEPATGPEVRVERLSLHVPEGWEVSKEGDPYSAQAGEGLNSIFVGELPDFGRGTLDLDDMAKTRLRNGPYLTKPKVLEPVSVAGEEWYHLAGATSDVYYTEDFGTVIDELSLTVAMTFDLNLPEAERQQIVDQVLASVSFD